MSSTTKMDNKLLFNLANSIGSDSKVPTLFLEDYEICALHMEDYLQGLENGYQIWKSIIAGPHSFMSEGESKKTIIYTSEEYEKMKLTRTISKKNRERIEIDLKAKRELRFALTPNVFRLVRKKEN